MKKTIKAVFSAALACLMALAVMPFSPFARALQPAWTVPDGYNENDYAKCVAFLEQTNENGVKNGTRINADYDPSDPESWGSGIQWAQRDDGKRVVDISLWSYTGLVGRLDASGFEHLIRLDIMGNRVSEIDVSGCTALLYLDCSNNDISALTAEDCTELIYLYCDTNALTELDVSALTKLEELDCNDNLLTAIDVSSCRLLEAFFCYGSATTVFDLSNNPLLAYDLVKAEGSGHVGYRFVRDDGAGGGEILAYPANGATFEGFYDANGTLLDEGYFEDSDGAYIYSFGVDETGTVIARFTGGNAPLAGDVDLNGTVNISDAVLALRCAMGFFELDALAFQAGDMNADGSITGTDAVTILRIAMGLS